MASYGFASRMSSRRCSGAVSACVEFARAVDYQRINRRTQSILGEARRIHAQHGYRRLESRAHALFGTSLPDATRELRLTDCAASSARDALTLALCGLTARVDNPANT